MKHEIWRTAKRKTVFSRSFCFWVFRGPRLASSETFILSDCFLHVLCNYKMSVFVTASIVSSSLHQFQHNADIDTLHPDAISECSSASTPPPGTISERSPVGSFFNTSDLRTTLCEFSRILQCGANVTTCSSCRFPLRLVY